MELNASPLNSQPPTDMPMHEHPRTDAPVHDSSNMHVPPSQAENNDARTYALAHEQTRTGAPIHAQTRIDTTSAPPLNWISVEECIPLFEKAGVPRKLRTIQKYCANGRLRSHLSLTEIGVRYFVDPTSITDFIERQAQLAPTMRDEENEPNPAHAHQRTDAPVREPEKSDIYLTKYMDTLEQENRFLKTQVEAKDKTIEALLERDKETNVLIQGLQKIFALASGRSTTNEPPTP